MYIILDEYYARWSHYNSSQPVVRGPPVVRSHLPGSLQAKPNIYLILRNKYSFSHKKWIFWGKSIKHILSKNCGGKWKIISAPGPALALTALVVSEPRKNLPGGP